MQDYLIKPGDTLSGIAQANGTDVATLARINNIPDPNKIAAGATLRLSDGPRTQEVPGVGTMTITPKGIPTAPPKNPDEDIGGAYDRAGLPRPTPPAAPLANAAVPGVPSYPSGVDSSSTIASMKKSYDETLASITALEKSLGNAAALSPEEIALKEQLAAKKAQLGAFDLGTLAESEALQGQGRGITRANIGIQDERMRRTRALERLGIAQEADTLTSALGMAQDQRKSLGEVAQTQYNLATKKLDIALGIATKMDTIAERERDNARQFLLDTVNFAEGKTYDQLDEATRTAIMGAVANSPITLDMVKTSLKTAADTAAANERGDLRSVAGVGLVVVAPDNKSYKVLVPENPTPAPSDNSPTFEEYVAAQNLPIASLVPEKVQALRSEYDAKYGNTAVNLGKLTPTQTQEITQANLGTAPVAVKSYFLNAPQEFRDSYQRDVAAGKAKATPTLDAMISAYTTWFNANKKGGTRDWSTLIPEKQATSTR